MSFNFSQISGSSGVTVITVSATSREELTDLTKFYTLANVVTEVNMPISQRAYEPLEKYINFQPSAITWSNSGGTANITITSNDEWYIVADEWIQLTRLSDMTEEPQTLSGNGNSVIGIRCYENVGSARTGGISGYCVSNSAISATTTVQQSGGYEKPYLYLDKYLYQVESSGYTGCSLSVYSNLDWTTISDARWIDINTVSGSNNGTILFDVQHTEQIVDRIGKITVSSTTESISVDCNVIQSPVIIEPYLYVSPLETTIFSSGGTFILSVSSNTTWETAIEYNGNQNSWISLSDLNGSGDTDVTVTIQQYGGQPTGRTATISFFNEIFGLRVVTDVIQRDSGNKIYYTTMYGGVHNPCNTSGWGVNIVSNTYEDGQGIIEFDGLLTTVPDSAFYEGTQYNDRLTSVILPETITAIGNDAFYFCSELQEINIPNSVETIGEYAFYSCRFFNVIIPDSVVSIGDYAFSKSGIRTLSIGSGLTEIPSGAFDGCGNLSGELTIPNNITSIGYSAFRDCSGVTYLNIQDSVTEIGASAFTRCKGITVVDFGDSLEIIGHEAFSSCYGLRGEIVIPDSVTTISERSFINCTGLTSLVIGSGVTSIGRDFAYLTRINMIYAYPTTAPSVSSWTFEGMPNYGTLHYPQGSNYSSFISKLPNQPNGWSAIADL